MLTEVDGTILDFVIYSGALDNVICGKTHTEKVVLHLMQKILNNGHSLYMDNFHNNFHLAKTLLEKNIFCTGTLRKERKDSPHDVIHAKLVNVLQ